MFITIVLNVYNVYDYHFLISFRKKKLYFITFSSPENKGGDVEKGPSKKTENKPPTDEIIPVYRRDCHEEVYCGSHTYPGQGVYLLKFDNSYSLWRSKTLYYRVYYSR